MAPPPAWWSPGPGCRPRDRVSCRARSRRGGGGPSRAATTATSAKAIWTDSHCHLQDEADPAATLAAARAVGSGESSVSAPMPSRPAGPWSWRASCRKARPGSGGTGGRRGDHSRAHTRPRRRLAAELWATVGLHPHDAKAGVGQLTELLDEVAGGDGGFRAARVVAIGECGLDYHYDNSPRDVQRDAFAEQVALALRHRAPARVHTRDAWDDTFAVLASEGMPDRTIIHCFTGGPPRRSGASTSAPTSPSAGSSPSRTPTRCARRLRSARSTACSSRRTRRFSRRFPIGAAGTSRAYVALVGEALAEVKGSSPRSWPRSAGCTPRRPSASGTEIAGR